MGIYKKLKTSDQKGNRKILSQDREESKKLMQLQTKELATKAKIQWTERPKQTILV